MTLKLHQQRFGRLVAVKFSHGKWTCQCDCGNFITVRTAALNNKNTRSCGCLRRDNLIARLHKHGLSKSREFRAWTKIKERCLYQSGKDFRYYGGRGIIICPQWINDFQQFFKDMGPCPPKMTIDRIDNSGPYSPENCRWTDRKEQANNRRSNIIIEINGKQLTLKQVSENTGIAWGTLWARLFQYHWPPDKILTPVRSHI